MTITGTAEWAHKVELGDVAQDDSLAFEAKRDAIVERLQATVTAIQADARIDDGAEFADIVEQLKYADDVEEFDSYLDDAYDWADNGKRLWLGMI